jgi:AcrR family transcriptional regulator
MFIEGCGVPTKPGKRARKGEEAAEPILAAAAGVFADRGFEGARVDEIARRAGVNKAMLYYRVGDKMDLYEAVLLRILSGARRGIEELGREAVSPGAKLEAVVRAVALAAASSPHYPRLLLRELAAGGAHLPGPVMRQMAGIAGLVRDILREGERGGTMRAADPLMTHLSILGAVMALNVSSPIRKRLLSRGIEVVPGNAFAEEIPAFVTGLVLGGLEKGRDGETGKPRNGAVSRAAKGAPGRSPHPIQRREASR